MRKINVKVAVAMLYITAAIKPCECVEVCGGGGRMELGRREGERVELGRREGGRVELGRREGGRVELGRGGG